jgi:hypothetical protein
VKVAIIDVTRNLNRAFENDLRLQREALVQPIDTKGYSDIASQVTLSAWKLFSSQVEVHSEYEVRRVADNPLQFQVISKKSVAKKGNIELQLFKFETLGSEPIPIELPKFHRIRRITVHEGFLICSCPFFSWYGIPCRHMLAVNKGRVQIADFYIRWTTEYARGMLDDVLREETITMSPGAISQASREDFPSSSCSSSAIQETERSHDEPPEIPDASDQPSSEEDDQQSSEEDASSERDSFEVIGRKKPRLDEHERFLESERLISELQEVRRHYIRNPAAHEFFVDNLQNLLDVYRCRMMKEQNISYQNVERGSIIDPLTVKSTSRSSARTKRADERYSSKGNRRKSTFNICSNPIQGIEVDTEPVLRGKGRPPKKK